MPNLILQNITSNNIVYGTFTVAPGQHSYENVSAIRSEWNAVGGVQIAASEDLAVTFNGSTVVVEQARTPADIAAFIAGFTLIFIAGLFALGAKWIRKTIGGGGGYSEL